MITPRDFICHNVLIKMDLLKKLSQKNDLNCNSTPETPFDFKLRLLYSKIELVD